MAQAILPIVVGAILGLLICFVIDVLNTAFL